MINMTCHSESITWLSLKGGSTALSVALTVAGVALFIVGSHLPFLVPIIGGSSLIGGGLTLDFGLILQKYFPRRKKEPVVKPKKPAPEPRIVQYGLARKGLMVVALGERTYARLANQARHDAAFECTHPSVIVKRVNGVARIAAFNGRIKKVTENHYAFDSDCGETEVKVPVESDGFLRVEMFSKVIDMRIV